MIDDAAGDDLLSEKAAARVLGRHPRTLRRWRETDKVAYFRTCSGRILYRIEDLVAAVRSELVIPAAPGPATAAGDRAAMSPNAPKCPQMPPVLRAISR